MTDFKQLHTEENRIEESRKIREKYPERIPIIVERSESCREIPDIDKHKFLVPQDLTMGQFVYVIRKRIKLMPEKSIFFFINNTMPPTSGVLSSIYNTHKNIDGFLYITYSSENVFG